ncbi:MAG: AAA family ATPase [Candidatus Marinimicrobia bacterium]|nr:AAA family ATPase [Candidatus Neomarinimicrobiota bacterium]
MRPRDVKLALENALDAQKAGFEVQPLFFWGPPGIGKSAVPREVCKERNLTLIDIRMSLLDPTDLRGIPAVVDVRCDVCRGTGGEKHDCAVCGGTGIRTVAKWLEPSMLPKGGEGIVIMDELTSAPPLQQASAYQFTLDRKIGEYELPDDYYIIAAGNNLSDRAVVYPMSTALRNRFTHINFEYNLDDWLEWARNSGINTHILAFLTWRGSELLFNFKPEATDKAFATPRSWHFASRVMEHFSKGIVRELLDGTIGPGAAAEFSGFMALQEQIPSIQKIFAGENIVPRDIGLKYALISALVSHAEKAAEFNRLLDYAMNGLPKEFSVLMAKLLTSKNRVLLTSQPNYMKWAKAHQDVLLYK